jgi:hypothetical protein
MEQKDLSQHLRTYFLGKNKGKEHYTVDTVTAQALAHIEALVQWMIERDTTFLYREAQIMVQNGEEDEVS